ncbi:uncharacterized protein LOC117555514 [Gymnodraco acuticeps]|uniref:Uncharacterized protein LOC117555514 n=1 Tax=Gymnodraco acuticeps TaxID=8218 RepID=A0A6P8WFL8_GYMAC|nr:uncharacterized protein LOC117555514 [Gymnodraco acuticeps]
MNPNQYIWILNEASQSSEGSDFDSAGGAVDGNKDLKLCTLSKEESDPWWRVDLEKVYKISAVTITNRDVNSISLNGAEIWIGNSMETYDSKNVRCAVISHIPGGRTFYFSCSATEGRYVTVLLPGSKKVLSLCEVEVFPVTNPVSNVALKGEATQSSTLSFATASKAIDGRRNSYYTSGFCSHTLENQADPWWRVDLRNTLIITSVKVTNRGDCCAERLDGAEIRIGNSLENNGNNNPRCASIFNIRAGKTYTYYCDGGSMEGRFVNVIIPGNMKTLTLCEVEVYGAPEDLSAEHNVSAVTITNSLSSKIEGAEIWIGNSEHETQNTRYIMQDTWFWMSGDSMKFTKWPRNIAPLRISSPCGGVDGGGLHLWGDRPCEEPLNFICQSGAELGAKRVYFHSSNTATSP